MSPFKIYGMEIRYDTTVGIAVVVLTMIFCTVVINRRLTINAEIAAQRDASNREVLTLMMSQINNGPQMAKELGDIINKNKELAVKLELNYENLQECAAKIAKQSKKLSDQ